MLVSINVIQLQAYFLLLYFAEDALSRVHRYLSILVILVNSNLR